MQNSDVHAPCLHHQDHQGRFTNERYWGMYTFGQRNLVVTDVELGKLITIRDADHFVDRSDIIP